MKWAAGGLALLMLSSNLVQADEPPYPRGPSKAALEFPHFPDQLHTFVFRNWGLVEASRLAHVLGTTPTNVQSVATSMGLPRSPKAPPEMLTRGYITLIRRNWHLLPYEQLEELLGLSAERLAHLLREDDFLWVKLGQVKPQVDRLVWTPPDEKARQRTAEIRAIVGEELAAVRDVKAEPRFAFLRRFQAPVAPREVPADPPDPLTQPPRFCYSYFALFGDPLLDPKLDPYPDALLRDLSAMGVTGVWLHVVLRDLASGGKRFPEFGRGHEERLKNLRRLVARAKRFGVGVYLYLNEPRAMPEGFFKGREDLAGVREDDLRTMCTSRPEVREWLSAAVEDVFRSAPDLAGVLTITASENLTNCASHHNRSGCPRCAKREPADLIAEVNAVIAAGVRAGSSRARVLVWDWGWADEWAAAAIAQLPQDVWLQSVSEWSLPVERGGVKTTVGEYSMSVVGPGPRAKKHWAAARSHGLRTVAKVQLNNTWELSSVPSLPVLDLVARHCKILATSGVDGTMLGWSLGGYPSPNLEVAWRFNTNPPASEEAVLNAVAAAYYGEGARDARQAWTRFSRALEGYPFHANVVYRSPVQVGPANLLYEKPTGYVSTMVGIPYDDARGWSSPYPPEVLAKSFEGMAEEWDAGLEFLERALARSPAQRRSEAEASLGYARTAAIHFRSVANQTRFTMSADAAERRRLAEDEARLARELLRLALADSRIGFEASNHYYFVPQDLIEKVINCQYLSQPDGVGQ